MVRQSIEGSDYKLNFQKQKQKTKFVIIWGLS